MAISELQLSTWSNIGATVSSQTTYTSIKAAIDSISWVDDIYYEVYLQGSYRNSTNIYGESDVDIVAQFNTVFRHNKNVLDQYQQQLFDQTFTTPGKYTLSAIRDTIIKGMVDYYGEEQVHPGDRAIDIDAKNGRLHADVLPCFEYRKYNSFTYPNSIDYTSGITFYSNKDMEWIINYPKSHYQNGVNKNSFSRTNENYKPLTRIFKNAKAYLVNSGIIDKGVAPSYFIQCLLYNLPDNVFTGNTYQVMVAKILGALIWRVQNNLLGNCVCQNEQDTLFGNSKVQWNIPDAITYINAVNELNTSW